jgi:Sulfotransferase family
VTTAVESEILAAETAPQDAASAATGFHDFGDPMYRNGLRVILRALREDHGLNGGELQSAVVTGPIATGLIGRLYAYRGFRDRPEYAQVPIGRPLIVAGLPRTGTTALHQLLAQDHRSRVTESWLPHTPMVRPPRDSWEEHPAYREARDRADADRDRLEAIHWVAADDADESNVLLRQTFSGNLSLRGPLPTYDAFFRARDMTAAYCHIADVLRLIGLLSQSGRGCSRIQATSWYSTRYWALSPTRRS